MKKLITLVFIVGLLIPMPAVFAQSSDIVICEIQTETLTSASEEYIQLCNMSGSPVDVSDWHVQYFSAGVTAFTTPSRNVVLSGAIDTDGTYIIASTGYKADVARSFFGATLAATGGHVRLTKGSGVSESVIDLVGWGTALLPETTAAELIVKGQVYKRATLQGKYVDTDNNKNDFAIPVSVPVDTGSDPTTPVGVPVAFGFVEIVELLPDPASPVLDVDGEFVELHNPNASAVNLEGYTIETGSNYSYSFTLHNTVINPDAYMAFYAPQTQLTLSNTEGRARIKDPVGSVVFETEPYAKAVTGSSWSMKDGAWAWTSNVTPNSANIILVNELASATTKKTSKTTTAAKQKAKTGVKGTTAKATASKTAASTSAYSNPPTDNKALPINPLVLAGVGTAALGYMVYEYRHDITNSFKKLKRNRTNRKQASR